MLRVTTDLGGLSPGVFDGEISLHSTTLSGVEQRSPLSAARLALSSAAVFSLEPERAHLGSVMTLRGDGFIGAPDRPGEATLLRFEGVVDANGIEAPFEREQSARWIDGQRLELDLEVEAREGALISRFFEVTRGDFRGQITPVALLGAEERAGEPQEVQLTILGPRQVVRVDFLPGFFESLERFGLSAAADVVQARALKRMSDIYEGFAVVISGTSTPDVLPSAVTVIEIGGPDPNGLGMFGYDNTPGKDVGNLRLFDRIGGANAATQADGFPGYGGVFIESMLYWSAHPELDAPLLSGPDPDPLFDEIFDPVRASPATLEEVQGRGAPERVAVVSRAIDALGAVIGETSAHELGHSLGLSQPRGPLDAYHSLAPGEGCLMDRGAERPFGERAAQPGFSPTRFCSDEVDYLDAILGAP